MKLIVCLFEGISYPLINDYLDNGLLPNFQKLRTGGTCGKLNCTPIPYEASGIVTSFSGVNVNKHGIISYWNPRPENYIPTQWNSFDISNLMFWNKEPYSHLNYALINLFGTQPTYKINGSILSYSMDKNLRYSYPKDLLSSLNKKGFPYVQDTCVFFTKDTIKTDFCHSVLNIDMLRKNVVLNLIGNDTDVTIVNFTAIDRISHFYFNEINNVQLESSMLYMAYKQCDNFLGEMMDLADKMNSKLIVFSEIGFGHLKKFVSINDYLMQKNFLKKDIENQNIIFDKTIAFESVQGSHGININSKKHFRDGIVDESEHEIVLSQIINELVHMHNPYNGNLMFKKVMTGSEFSQSNLIPDIILEPFDWEYLPYGDPYWANHVSRNFQTGWHRSESFWGYLGSIEKPNNILSLIDIYDLIIKSII